MRQLILGGVRSGKSRLAERLAHAAGGNVHYLATARAQDEAMVARIAEHRRYRPRAWTTHEVGAGLGDALAALDAPGNVVLIDCLTLWLTQILCEDDMEATLVRERASLLQAAGHFHGELIMVSNETGFGIMPMNALSRRFGDEAGLLHQDLAEVCERVMLCVAGLPQMLKSPAL